MNDYADTFFHGSKIVLHLQSNSGIEPLSAVGVLSLPAGPRKGALQFLGSFQQRLFGMKDASTLHHRHRVRSVGTKIVGLVELPATKPPLKARAAHTVSGLRRSWTRCSQGVTDEWVGTPPAIAPVMGGRRLQVARTPITVYQAALWIARARSRLPFDGGSATSRINAGHPAMDGA